MIIANTLGYEASTESIVALQQLLSMLNAFPADWAEVTPVNAEMVGDDVAAPQLSPTGFVLIPSTVWIDAEDAWRDVGIVVDGGDVRPFGLEAPTIREAKERIQALLQDYEASVAKPAVTEPILPGVEPIDPYPVAPPVPELPPSPPVVEPAVPAVPAVPPMTAAIQPVKGVPGWAWAALSAVGLGTIVAVVVGTAKRKRRLDGSSDRCEQYKRKYKAARQEARDLGCSWTRRG